MISLNTLRTRFGVVLSIVIVLALLAFIISLGPEMGFFGSRDPKVGEINGDNITYSEYLKEYETIKQFNGGDESSEESIDRLTTAAWQSLVAKHMLVPGFEDMGVVVSSAALEGKRDKVLSAMNRAVRPDSITIEDHIALIAVVGRGMVKAKGTAARVFNAISDAGINIRMIDQGSSEFSIIVGIEDHDFDKALRAIYAEFVK
jgi:aspartokinase